MAGLGSLFISICKGAVGNIDDFARAAQSAKPSSAVSAELTSLIGKPNNTRTQLLRGGVCDNELIQYADNPTMFYTHIRDKIYNKLRAGKEMIYKSKDNYIPKDFHEALMANSNGFHSEVRESWVYRFANSQRKHLPIVDRISLNVYQDKELIEKLDKYLLKNVPTAFYKCPGAGKIGWNSRHDVITIYLSELANDKLLRDIAELAKPHIRNNVNEIMLGKKIAQGVYQVQEPTLESIKPLLIKAKMMNLEPEFYEWLGHPDFYSGAGLFNMVNGQRVLNTSPGAVESLRRMLEIFEKVLG